jgi:hypothetical protein
LESVIYSLHLSRYVLRPELSFDKRTSPRKLSKSLNKLREDLCIMHSLRWQLRDI